MPDDATNRTFLCLDPPMRADLACFWRLSGCETFVDFLTPVVVLRFNRRSSRI
jgi:hypothetical protein